MNKSVFYLWFLATRPKTLTAAVAPVLIGTAMAYKEGHINLFITIFTFLAAIAIQIGTNFANDFFDFINGADTEERIGPERMTQKGYIKPFHMFLACAFCFTNALVFGLILLLHGGWPIFFIGTISIICGVLYTGGPIPYGYHGYGDLFVLIFFGPVAVGGTYYLQTLSINSTAILAGFAPGFISTAILAVNNLRDIKSDTKTQKRTLAVKYGADFIRKEYYYCIAIACIIPIIIILINFSHFFLVIVPPITYLIALPLFKRINQGPIDETLNKLLAKTSFLLILYAVLFSICW